jgi:large repetitive protein
MHFELTCIQGRYCEGGQVLQRVAELMLLCSITVFFSCGGDGSRGGGSTSTQPAVSITSAGPATVDASDTVMLNATVSNDSSNEGVTWTLSTNPMSSSSTTATSATFVPSATNTSTLSYTVTATSKAFPSVSNSITITVNALPTITSSGSITTATEGSSYSVTLNESGGTGTLTWSLASGTILPAGLT